MAFPRALPPAKVSPFRVPTGLVSLGQTGRAQLRNMLQMGREWTEAWAAIAASSADAAALLAYIAWCYNTSQVFDITHLTTPGSGLAPNGAGGGTPLIKGASQTGETIITDGWSNGVTGVVKAGDVVRINGLSPLYQNVLTVNSNGSGEATLTLNPPIPAGYSPADNAPITRTGCTLSAYISEPPSIPEMEPDQLLVGLTLTFREAL